MGHFHSSEQFRNGTVVGVNANLDMDYSSGYNGIIPANALIHPDSSVQLLHIIHTEKKSYWR